MQAMWHAVKTWSAVCLMVSHSQFDRERDPIVHKQMKSHNTNLKAIYLNPSCSEQAHSNKPNIGNRHETTKPGCFHTAF